MNNLVHVTNYGDFNLDSIEVFRPFLATSEAPGFTQTSSFKFESNPETRESPFSFESLEGHGALPMRIEEAGALSPGGEFLEEEKKEEKSQDDSIDLGNLDLEEPGAQKAFGGGQMIEEEGPGTQNSSDISFTSMESSSALPDGELYRKRLELKARDESEFDFEDEVEFPSTTVVRERLRKYKALKNFKQAEWNPLSELSEHLKHAVTFADFKKSKNVAKDQYLKAAVAFNSTFVRITLNGFPAAALASHDPSKPFVLSSLVAHEQKMSMLHMKVSPLVDEEDDQKNEEEAWGGKDRKIKSDAVFEVWMGFRRFRTKLLFSQMFTGSKKTKKLKYVRKEMESVLCSCFCQVLFKPQDVLIFRVEGAERKECVLAGALEEVNPLKVILKRVILTGYPIKVILAPF